MSVSWFDQGQSSPQRLPSSSLPARIERIVRLTQTVLQVAVVSVRLHNQSTDWTVWDSPQVAALPLNSLWALGQASGHATVIKPTLKLPQSVEANVTLWRFGAYYPLRNAQGLVIGAVVLGDLKPHSWQQHDQQIYANCVALLERELANFSPDPAAARW